MRLGPGNNTTNLQRPSSEFRGVQWLSGYAVTSWLKSLQPGHLRELRQGDRGSAVGDRRSGVVFRERLPRHHQPADLIGTPTRTRQVGPSPGTSWGYGQTVDRLRQLDAIDGKRQPIWNFVEVGWPWGETPGTGGLDKPTPAEIRGAVWHSLIAGARGIIYFQHSFTGSCQSHHALRETGSSCYGAVIDGVRSVDAQIKSLAPVLNAPTVSSGTSSSSNIRTMTKWQGGNFYVFAGARATGTNATFSIPCVGNATATRIAGESGSVAVTNGTFVDNFADTNAIHIYRIDGGSRCGL